MRGSLTERERLCTVDLLVLTGLVQLLFILKILITFYTIQPTVMRRSIVLILPAQLVFPGRWQFLKRQSLKEVLQISTKAFIKDSLLDMGRCCKTFFAFVIDSLAK